MQEQARPQNLRPQNLGLLSERNVEISQKIYNEYYIYPNFERVIDDGGVHAIVGTHIRLGITRGNGKDYVTSIFNQLYYQEIIDENGEIINNTDGFTILEEALMRGKR